MKKKNSTDGSLLSQTQKHHTILCLTLMREMTQLVCDGGRETSHVIYCYFASCIRPSLPQSAPPTALSLEGAIETATKSALTREVAQLVCDGGRDTSSSTQKKNHPSAGGLFVVIGGCILSCLGGVVN